MKHLKKSPCPKAKTDANIAQNARNTVANKYFFFEDYDGEQLYEIFLGRVKRSDYKLSVRTDGEEKTTIELPKSNVLEYRLENGSKLIVRPSGTEPKIKIYLSGKGKTRAESEAIIAEMKTAATALLGL